jgi:hypothetical protein
MFSCGQIGLCKGVQKGDNVTIFGCSLKNLDPLIKSCEIFS